MSVVTKLISLFIYNDLYTWRFVIPGEKKIFLGASSHDVQVALEPSSLQRDDVIETLRQSYLRSGKFNSLYLILSLEACCVVSKMTKLTTNHVINY